MIARVIGMTAILGGIALGLGVFILGKPPPGLLQSGSACAPWEYRYG